MNFARNIVVSLLVFGFTVSFASARENLRVLYVYDTITTNYSQSYIDEKSKTLNKQLNDTFKNSELSSYIYFNKLTAVNVAVSIGNEKLGDIVRRYNRNKSSYMVLRQLQRSFHADVVVTVMDSGKYDSECGMAINIPWSYLDFQDPEYSYVFLNSNKKKNCLGNSTLIAHEVGHIFGLHHGEYVAKDTGESKNFFKNGYNNGFGVDVNWGIDYGTVMTKGWLAINNRFSDPTKNECGTRFNSGKVCGDSHANSVKFIKKWAKYYNRRGGWFFTLVKNRWTGWKSSLFSCKNSVYL